MSQRITLRDATRCLKLVEECTEMWADPLAWQDHLTTGAERLIGGCGSLYAMSHVAGGGPATQESHIAANTDLSIRQAFDRYMRAGGLRLMPELETITPILLSKRQLTYRQSTLLSRDQYYRSEMYQRFLRADRIEDLLSSTNLRGNGIVVGLSIQRRSGEPRFSARDEAVQALLTALISDRLGRRLATRAHTASYALSPRLRDVLAELLDGTGEKEIANRLGISRATAHEHVTAIYRRFDVRSRAQLMAHFLRRRALNPRSE